MRENESYRAFDCYVRLQETAFQGTRLLHIESGLDSSDESEHACSLLDDACQPPVLCGYTEWMSDFAPIVSVGWDWSTCPSGALILNSQSIRTNVMLVDEHGMDRGRMATINATIKLINRWPWQQVVQTALQIHPPLDD